MMHRHDDLPKPGSKAALKTGCTCPVSDNAHGEGVAVGGQIMHWRAPDCPLHGQAELERRGQQRMRDL